MPAMLEIPAKRAGRRLPPAAARWALQAAPRHLLTESSRYCSLVFVLGAQKNLIMPSLDIATQRVARGAATPCGASYSHFVRCSPAGGDPTFD